MRVEIDDLPSHESQNSYLKLNPPEALQRHGGKRGGKERKKIYYLSRTEILMRKRTVQSMPEYQQQIQNWVCHIALSFACIKIIIYIYIYIYRHTYTQGRWLEFLKRGKKSHWSPLILWSPELLHSIYSSSWNDIPLDYQAVQSSWMCQDCTRH